MTSKPSRWSHRSVRLLLFGALLLGLVAQPAAAHPEPPPDLGTDREVAFDAQGFRVHGSLRVPAGADGPVPAAVIIGGSGTNDRHGNIPGFRVDVLDHLADTLAAAGVASLRYDEPGAGRTSIGPLAEDPSLADFDLLVDIAADAAGYLASRPEADPDQVMLLGHSEGALINLVLGNRDDLPVEPAAIGLLAAPGIRLLDLVAWQLERSFDRAVEAGQMTEEQAAQLLAEVERAITSLRETGEFPTDLPEEIMPLFTPGSEAYWSQVDAHDPAELAAGLPADLPVYLACGEGDVQVPCDDVELVAEGLSERGGDRHDDLVRLADVNHMLQELGGRPSTGEEYTAGLPHSAQLRETLGAFVTKELAAD